MDDRSPLGPADVTDEQLALMVVELLGSEPAETSVVSSAAEEVAYDIPAITTAGRYWVRGTAEVRGEQVPFAFFVKHVQSWSRSELFQLVPTELQPMAAAGVPWRTEHLAYRSDLGDRLPAGLTMPRALGVYDLDELSSSVWLEVVPVRDIEWDLPRYTRAAHLLGRLAVSPRVAELRDVGASDWHLAMYYEGRLSAQVLPMLRDDGIWRHPLVAGAFDEELRERLLRAADRSAAYTEELAAMPMATAHGDACPNNLLVREGSENFVLIDYGFWGPNSIGYDLGQLLVGDVQLGRASSEGLAELESANFAAYMAGLRAEECSTPDHVVRRAHALQLMLFTGLSTLPFEYLESEPTPALHRLAADRAALARFSLDLLDATS
jgi:hypothetical protein